LLGLSAGAALAFQAEDARVHLDHEARRVIGSLPAFERVAGAGQPKGLEPLLERALGVVHGEEGLTL
jgi:hypothetical protein